MRISKQARRDAKELFRGCLVEGRLDEGRVLRVVQEILDRRPRGHHAILGYFQRLVKLEIDRRAARVDSATPLPGEMQDAVRARLEGVHGPGLELTFATRPELVGGMRVRVGFDVYDGSVRGRLDRLREAF